MARYIEKDALVAEIKKRIKETESMQPKFDQFWAGQINAFKGILKILDTIEVKEVDLEKEFNSFLDNVEGVPRIWHNSEQTEWGLDIARHFFELGLKAQKGE